MTGNGHFGINTCSYCLTHSAEDCLKLLAGLGFKAIELMLYPGHLWIDDSPASLRRILNAVRTHDLTIANLNMANVDMNLTAAAPEMRDYTLELWQHFLHIAGELGARGIIIGPGKPNPLLSLPQAVMEGYFFRALDILLPQAERAGVQLWAENMPFAFPPRAGQLMDTLERYGASQIGICYDVANAHFIGEDPCEGLARIDSRLAHLHLSDTDTTAYRHNPVGAGTVDFQAIARALKTSGWNRMPFLETITEDPGRDLPASIDRLTQLGW